MGRRTHILGLTWNQAGKPAAGVFNAGQNSVWPHLLVEAKGTHDTVIPTFPCTGITVFFYTAISLLSMCHFNHILVN
jgi:hypothetical protein